MRHYLYSIEGNINFLLAFLQNLVLPFLCSLFPFPFPYIPFFLCSKMKVLIVFISVNWFISSKNGRRRNSKEALKLLIKHKKIEWNPLEGIIHP